MKKSYFISATDTSVGKTFFAAGLAASLQSRGHSVGILKPVETGAGERPEATDGRVLARVAHWTGPIDAVTPYVYDKATSPHLAARLNDERFDESRILGMHEELREKREVVLVEGAGGVMVPLRDDYAVADLIHELSIPLILIARASLGTLNHTLLTLRCCQDYNLEVVGIVVNVGPHPRGDLAESTNAEELGRISGVPILGTLPYLPPVEGASGGYDLARLLEDGEAGEAELRRLGEHVQGHVNVDQILRWEGY